MMIFSFFNSRTVRVCLILCLLVPGLYAGEIPAKEIQAVQEALAAAKQEEGSEARKRLAVKRVVRDAEKLLETHGDAPNRFAVLGILFGAHQQLFGMDDSARNRAAVLETAQALLKAPDDFAGQRLEADLLITQADLARRGAGPAERMEALNGMVARYRGTAGEKRMLQTAMVMALEAGDSRVVRNLRKIIEERFAGDFEMINFQREKLGGQVFAAPFTGVFQRSDGGTMHLPADGLGRTLLLYFWTSEPEGRADLEALASYWKVHRDEIAGRIHLVSFNVDELPDAGEMVLRELGLEWPALHLPQGRNNPRYEIFAKRDGALVTVTPTGQAAIVMEGATRSRKGETNGVRDFERWFGSSLARVWTEERYVNQLTAIFAGDFLVENFEENLKSASSEIPEETFQAIQDCFVPPPVRYRLALSEIRANYERALDLTGKALTAHPGDSLLWVLRNRRLVALLGLWKVTGNQAHYREAVGEAQRALQEGMPPSAEVVPRYVLAKEELRQPEGDPAKVIREFVEKRGGAQAPGPALAVASLLSLDVADRAGHEHYRSLVLEHHLDDPAMWTFGAFLLDRHHRYWLYRVPFVAGWSYGRRSGVLMSVGDPDEAERTIKGTLETLDGKAFDLPIAGSEQWTVVLFTEVWDDPKKASIYATVERYLNPKLSQRGLKDVKVVVAVLGTGAAKLRALLEERPLDGEVVLVPGGVRHPLVRQFGVINEDERSNALVIRPDGKVVNVLSGLSMERANGEVIMNIIEWQDRQAVADFLAAGELAKAKEMIFTLAPPFDPMAVDAKGRPLKKPEHSLSHLRARARVYLAMKEWDKALADAQEVAQRKMEKDGWMSLRTEQLDRDEAFVEEVKEAKAKASR